MKWTISLLFVALTGVPQTLFAQEYQPDSHTVALWHFNEVSGSTVSDAGTNGNTGEAVGTSIVDGKFGKSRSFDGSGDYVNLPETASLTGISTAITLEAWVYSSGYSGGSVIASGNQNDYALAVYNTGQLRVDLYGVDGASGGAFESQGVITTDAWHHIAVTYDGSIERIFIDGNEDTSRAATGVLGTSPQGEDIAIGSYRGSGPNYFNGLIDEVRISDIARHRYEFNVPGIYGLVAHYPFNGNANDESGNGNDAVPAFPVLATDRFGNVDRAYSWNGVTDKMRVGDADAFKFTTSMSIACWAFAISSPPGRAYAQIAFRGDDRFGIDPYFLAVHPDGILRFHVSSGSSDEELDAPMEYGEWQHYVAILNDATNEMKIYINGQEVAGKTTSVRPFAELDTSYSPGVGLGNTQSYSTVTHHQPFDGKLDDFRFYNRALNQSEIDSLYHLGGWPPPQKRIIASAGPHGSIIPGDTVYVDSTGDQVFTIEPDPGYIVDSVVVDGVNIDPVTEYTFTHVTIDHTIHAAFRLLTLVDGLVAYYPFNGNVNDESGNGHHGINHGATTSTDRFGRTDSAFLFDGNAYIDLGTDSALNLTNGFILTAWMKDGGGAGIKNILARWDILEGVNERTYGVGLQHSNRPYAIVSRDGTDYGSVTVEGGSPLNEDEWYFVAATYDLSTMKLYVDGDLVASHAQSGIMVSPNTRLGIGATIGRPGDDTSGGLFNGVIDDIRIYNYLITESLLDSLYHEGGWPLPGHTIYASSGPHGSITPAGPVVVPFGADRTFSIIPDSGYVVESLLVDGDPVDSTSSYTFADVTADHSIHAVFGGSHFNTKVGLTVTQDIYSKTLYFGAASGAAYGIWGVDPDAGTIDASEGEIELPPTVSGVFDARFVDPRYDFGFFGQGSWVDIRSFTHSAQKDSHLVQIQRVPGETPVILRWSSAEVSANYLGPVTLGKNSGVLADMKATDSLVVANVNTNDLYIITDSPNLPSIYESGWNLVSLPVDVEDGTISTLFPGVLGPAWSFDVLLGYLAQPVIEPGSGYWLKLPFVVQTQGYSGEARNEDTIDVSAGWNLVGALTDRIPVSSIGSDPPGIVTGQFFGYHQGYYAADSLEPRRGYWVKATQAGRLFLSSVSNYPGRIVIKPTGELPPPPPGEESPTAGPVPTEYSLGQNYPNPFNPATTIQFTLPEKSHVTLQVFNILGQVETILIEGEREAGYTFIQWDASDRSSGVYFYKLTAGTFSETKKMILIR